MAETFTRKEVERSFRKFNDIVSDLFQSTYQTWGNVFTHLMTHCEQDSVMREVMAPLRHNQTVNAEDWYAEAMNGIRGGSSSGYHYTLPYDDADRTALLFKFFLLIEHNKVDLCRFCMKMYNPQGSQDSVRTFNQELVLKFTREVSYRLDDILAEIGARDVVPREVMLVFHKHDNTMHFHGNIQGSNIAVNGSTVSNSSASFTTSAEVADALKSLKSLIHEVAENQRLAVENALQALVDAATQPSVTAEAVQQAAATVAEGSTSLKERLTDVAKKVGLSLLGSSIFQGLKMALHLT